MPEVEVLKNELGNTEIALTLIRSVGWLSRDDLSTRKSHAGPMGIETPEAQMLGKHRFEYSIISGSQDWHKPINLAQAFNAPMRAVDTTVHAGKLPVRSYLVMNDNQYFIITSIKLSEDETGLIVRGYNILSTPIE